MSSFDLAGLNEKIQSESQFLNIIKTNLSSTIIGQDDLINKLLLAILANGHVFLEGVPGLAKTLTVKSLADLIDTKFQRLQFTPDLLPADILGTLIYNPQKLNFEVKKGPIFSNIVLADEINRAPAKVQSALLEAMQERQVTIGGTTFNLDSPFLVMATQNPIEQEGTYPLPEAQVDRFMFKIIVDYPSEEEELKILQTMGVIENRANLAPVVKAEQILNARKVVDQIHIAENIQKYIVSLILSTRNPENYGMKDLKGLIEFGASPRATIYMSIAAKAAAFMSQRGYVIPEDIREVGRAILRHRIILTYEAEAEDITTEDIITRIFESIPTP
ncbi:MAG: MoxR family ATPase [Candidatus Marinimicrobia bacterium]|jgi:MoxR-like ATPase|nr:MoxR family ATPase [Candidatus Neomarinimicrobiota bacterium]MBT3633370.1 MoxR family ATPase [Candidatus Neomarinimicrobiota bacterium]MBT3681513.1 MoxR family ATPase [Candidatus Neomarinimicrobiota bacterium]MBT3758520.1 MoxR family ATPase [Candidatus Neomarinimicrobiota bacterium]MBT3894826.1 MoxR family ATPase [Candidatus Neomarinimicrobiota bacterium]